MLVQKSAMGFLSITLKVANMKSEQRFTIYPYKGGDTLTIQSGKRIASLNIRTGKGQINAKNEQNGAYFHHLTFGCIDFELPTESLTSLQAYFWNNEGKDGGSSVLTWENKELFSEV